RQGDQRPRRHRVWLVAYPDAGLDGRPRFAQTGQAVTNRRKQRKQRAEGLPADGTGGNRGNRHEENMRSQKRLSALFPPFAPVLSPHSLLPLLTSVCSLPIVVFAGAVALFSRKEDRSWRSVKFR